MSEEEDDVFAVTSGSLKLKGVVAKKSKKKSKKSKKKEKKRRRTEGEAGVDVGAAPSGAVDELEPVYVPVLTAAEQRQQERKKRADDTRLGKLAEKTHRERINDYNTYLASLSEIHDIPKVGPG